MSEHESHHATGFVCPRCDGALWEHPERDRARFECRIGDAFSALELWVEHCAARNQALKVAARAVAENAGLARHLVAWARERGDDTMARRLEEEADSEDAVYEQLHAMLPGLDEASTDGSVT